MKIFLSMILYMNFGLAIADEVDEFAEFDNEQGASAAKEFQYSGMLEVEQGPYISNKKMRLQLERPLSDQGGLFSKTDFIHDDIAYHARIDIRELRLQYKLSENIDLSLGRQVSTWGVGDMLFINDLFPKNWIANFQGRDMEMLKDPSNSIRLTNYGDIWSTDLVYTPKFSADSFPRGCYFSVFNPNTASVASNNEGCSEYTAKNSDGEEIENGEISIAVKRKIKNHELSLYYYNGYYKAPKAMISTPSLVPVHTKLNVYGLSDEGQWGPGIFSFEFGYYESLEDQKGDDYLVENSKLKYLIGYRMDISSSFSFGTQWYQEKMQNYSKYEDSVLFMNPGSYSYRKKEYQNTFTLRLTYKAMQDTLFVSLFSYLRPEDKDSFTKFEVAKKITDDFKITTGVNSFSGTDNYLDREFGMLKDDDHAFIRLNMNF